MSCQYSIPLKTGIRTTHLFSADDVVDVALLQLLRFERVDQVRRPLRPRVVQVRLLASRTAANMSRPALNLTPFAGALTVVIMTSNITTMFPITDME